MSGKTWAQRTKEATNALKPVSVNGNDLEPITTYYQLTAPRTGAPDTAARLEEGQTINGVYEGNFTTKKFGTKMYKVRTDSGKLVAITGSAQLNMLMAKVADGAEVSITYNGKEVIKKGRYEGKEAHGFSVAASELKAS